MNIFKILGFGITLVFFSTSPVISKITKLDFANVSSLPILAEENANPIANLILIIGGAGLRNGDGRSKNYLVKQATTFFNANLNYYLLTNWRKSEKATYSLRASMKRAKRILSLIKSIKQRNSKPIWLIGFSRGSVDAGYFAKKYPKEIRGIVLASGVYKNNSKKARFYSLENIIKNEVDTAVLIAHHIDDKCNVTKYAPAKSFFNNLNARTKYMFTVEGGHASGRDCGPLNHHGFEGVEKKVARKIAVWIKINSS